MVVFGAGDGVGSGSAPADAAQPASSRPAVTNRAATGAPTLNRIEQQPTGVSSSFRIHVVPARKGKFVLTPCTCEFYISNIMAGPPGVGAQAA
jgi:hypothetical protein